MTGDGLKFYDLLEGKGPIAEKGQSVLVILLSIIDNGIIQQKVWKFTVYIFVNGIISCGF